MDYFGFMIFDELHKTIVENGSPELLKLVRRRSAPNVAVQCGLASLVHYCKMCYYKPRLYYNPNQFCIGGYFVLASYDVP